jgi:uncharacterized SAM-binding protein YcdF (DUF218 family)
LASAGLVGAWHPSSDSIKRYAARVWIVNDQLQRGDAVVVLGGGADERALGAADIFMGGYAPLILVSDPSEAHEGTTPSAATAGQVAVDTLRTAGVPESAIVRFGVEVKSTRDEAYSVGRWMKEHAVRRIIVPTDPFHTRRVRLIFDLALRGLQANVTVVALPNKRYDPQLWWKSEEATQTFQREVTKFLFYCLTSPTPTLG